MSQPPPSRRSLDARISFIVATVLSVALTACGGTSIHEERQSDRVVSEHKFLGALVPTKLIGEDCATEGRAACLSGHCIHFTQVIGAGYSCTRKCNDDMECPSHWVCASVLPGSRFCLPPRNWTAQVAAERPIVTVP